MWIYFYSAITCAAKSSGDVYKMMPNGKQPFIQDCWSKEIKKPKVEFKVTQIGVVMMSHSTLLKNDKQL